MARKALNIGFKDIDIKSGIVTGWFAHFGSKDHDGDIVEQGAFKKTIQERGPNGKKLIKWLLDHDRTKVPGVLSVLEEDSIGLYYEGKAGRHTLGRDFLLMAEDGIINQHSFGYKTIKEQYDQGSKANLIKEVMLYEGSAIQFLGANENTPLAGIKSLEDALEYIKKLKKFIGSSVATDETLKNLSEQLKSLQSEIEPLINTQEDEKPITAEMLKSTILKNLSYGTRKNA